MILLLALLAALTLWPFLATRRKASHVRAVEDLCEQKLRLVIRRAYAVGGAPYRVGGLAEHLEKRDDGYLFKGVPLVAFGPMTRTSRFWCVKARYAVSVSLPNFPGGFDLEVFA